MKKAKKYLGQRVVIIFSLITGILVSVYLKNYKQPMSYIPMGELNSMEENIRLLESEIVDLNNQKRDYEETINQYKENKENIQEYIEDELDKLQYINGKRDIIGEGISVSVYDSEKEFEQGDDPNDFLIHDIDMLRIVNDLKMAGATAIQINDHRILQNTPIKCSGTTITIGNRIYNQPFVIEAVGDIDHLKAAIISPNSYSGMLKDTYGIKFVLEESEKIEIK